MALLSPATVLLSPAAYRAVLYGAIGLAAVSIIWLIVAAELAARRMKRDPAVAETRPGAVMQRRALVRWIGVAGLLAGLGSAGWLWWYSIDVVVVTDGAVDPVVTRRVWVGARDHYAARAPEAYCHRDPTWVLNESSRTLELQSIGYGDAHTFSPEPVAPRASTCVDSVDHVGPDDVPPSEITVKRTKELSSAGVPQIERRVWLTWDR